SASRRRNAWSRRRCAKPLEPDGSASSSTVIVELPTPPYIEVTYATYRCALRCGGAGGFERAGLGRLEVYSRRDWIRCWKRVRDDDLRADQGHVLRSRRNRQRTDRDRVAADGGQSGDGDLWRVLDG